MKRCIVGLRHPDQAAPKTGPNSTGKAAPTVWFASMASLAAVLSDDNRALLRVIHSAKPSTLTELAALTGRKVPNLSRTVKTMAGYGLLELQRNSRDLRPIALATEFLVVLD